ncbi:MAG: divalent metal cation transporter [bacterium]
MGKNLSTIQSPSVKTGTAIKHRRNLRQYFTISPNGVVTAAADNDPTGIATYLQAGATTGLSLLWLVAILVPLASAVEEMSARVGVVTKKGITRLIREHYGVGVAMVVAAITAICNIVAISAGIEVVADLLALFTPIPSIAWIVIVAGLLVWLLIKNGYQLVSRYLIGATVVLMLYVITAIIIRPDWLSVAQHFVSPVIHIEQLWLLAALGIVGNTLAPYLIIWQTTEELESKKTIHDLRQEATGVIWGFVYSGVIAASIIITAAVVYAAAPGLITSTADAALALKPIAGQWALILFGLGMLVSGILGIPVLVASTAYMSAEALHWREGLGKSWHKVGGFYGIIIITCILAAIMTLANLPSMVTLLYSQVLSGALTPIMLFIMLLMGNNPRIMGRHINPWLSNLLGGLALALVLGLDVIWLLIYC